MYKNLRAEMSKKDITNSDLAEVLEVRYATVSDKINGHYRFYFDEALKIKTRFFPECELEYLFSASAENPV